MGDVIERARALRPKIEQLSSYIEDDEAPNFPEMFPKWDGSGVEVTAGDRYRYGADVYKVITGHTTQPDWSPDEAPSLFAKVLIPDPNAVPVWEQPDSTNGYMTGDRVRYPDETSPVYESLIDNNVWSPESYPDGWNEVNE